ncbi:MAG: SHOCT domain-containing protein [Clostridia bacterium]|nr:SHOCT domain-containing protein [Clostridia bacterium]
MNEKKPIKRILSIIELILQIALIAIVCAVPYETVSFTSSTSTSVTTSSIGITYLVYTIAHRYIIDIILFILMAANILLSAISAFDKSFEKDNVLHYIVPILMLLFSLICFSSRYVGSEIGKIFPYFSNVPDTLGEINPFFNIISKGLIIAIIILVFVKNSKKFVINNHNRESIKADDLKRYKDLLNNATKSDSTSASDNYDYNTESSQIDVLKKYKDLLDNNIITQEEFDAKKRQLLDL